MKILIKSIGVLAASLCLGGPALAATPAELLPSCISLASTNCQADPSKCLPENAIRGESDAVLKTVCEHALKGTFLSTSNVGIDGKGIGCAVCANVQNTNAQAFSAICTGKIKGLSLEQVSEFQVPADNRACFYGIGMDLGL